jgi:hypothetical protein
MTRTRENPPGWRIPAGLREFSFGDDNDQAIAQNQTSSQGVWQDPRGEISQAARLRFLATRLHALGPKPLFHFLGEIENGAPLRPLLERYARLFPLAVFIREHHGDQFAPPLVVKGGEP